MAYEQRDNSGSLFKNDRKEKDAQPDYTGRCMVDGKIMRVAGWKKDGPKGTFVSLKFSDMESKGDAKPAQRQTDPMDLDF